MLNFKNVRKATEDMLVKAKECTENFWQEVFKIFEDYDTTDCLVYYDVIDFPCVLISRKLYDMFFTLEFEVHRTCYGKITVKFTKPTDEKTEVAFQLSSECLLENHFTCVDDCTFVLSNVHEITS